jgi:hypothetical protein
MKSSQAVSPNALLKIMHVLSNTSESSIKKNSFLREVKSRLFDKSLPLTPHWISSINMWAEKYTIYDSDNADDIHKIGEMISLESLLIVKRRKKIIRIDDNNIKNYSYQFMAEKNGKRYWFSTTTFQTVNNPLLNCVIGDYIKIKAHVKDISDGIYFLNFVTCLDKKGEK